MSSALSLAASHAQRVDIVKYGFSLRTPIYACKDHTFVIAVTPTETIQESWFSCELCVVRLRSLYFA